MKKSFYMLFLICSVLIYGFTVSCNKTPTYEEMKAAEKKIIKRMLIAKDIEVLSEYPENGVFGENQFVELSSGIYLNVIDSGNGNRAEVNKTYLLVRSSGEYYYGDTTITFNTFSNTSPPFEFKYGLGTSVVEEHKYAYDIYYYYFGLGMETVLNYVGDSAVVKLLVPGYAEISSYPASSTFQNSGANYEFIPIYFDRVRYVFY